MKLNKVPYHVLAWLIYITYELVLLRLYSPIAHPRQVLVLYLLEVLLFYCNFFWFREIAKSENKDYRRMLLPLGPILLLLIFSLLKWEFGHMFHYINKITSTPEQLHKYFAGIIFRSALTIGESIGYWIFYRSWQKEKRIHEMELEAEREKRVKLELQQELNMAYNAWLQSRINPHLLYNTLNFFYSKLSSHPELKVGIELLVRIMRFSMGKPGQDGLVSINDEWEQVENYIKLQQLRFDKRQYINYIFINNNPDIRLPPVVLLTLVENIYKHGNLDDEKHPASLKLITSTAGWRFSISNTKRNASHKIPGEHLGMENVRTRLRQAYGKQNFTMTTGDYPDNLFMLDVSVY